MTETQCSCSEPSPTDITYKSFGYTSKHTKQTPGIRRFAQKRKPKTKQKKYWWTTSLSNPLALYYYEFITGSPKKTSQNKFHIVWIILSAQSLSSGFLVTPLLLLSHLRCQSSCLPWTGAASWRPYSAWRANAPYSITASRRPSFCNPAQ